MTPDEIKSNLKFIGNYCDYDFDDISFDGVISEALAYINELEAEVERLEHLADTKSIMINELSKACENIRAKSIREFAEKLQTRMQDLARLDNNGLPLFLVSEKFIDEIVEEMVGEIK